MSFRAKDDLVAYLRRLAVDQRIDALQALLSCNWSAAVEFRENGAELEKTSIGSDVFSTARDAIGSKLFLRIQEHVGSEYLKRKVGNYLGKKPTEVNDNTIMCIPADHGPAEGKLKASGSVCCYSADSLITVVTCNRVATTVTAVTAAVKIIFKCH